MSITEAERHELHQRLEEVLGPNQANILMEHLPPVGWADVAKKQDLAHLEMVTKRDIAHLEMVTKRDIAHLETVTTRDITSLRTELQHHTNSLRSEMDNLGTSLRSEMREQNAELRAAVLHDQRTYVFAMLGAYTALMAVALTVIRLV